MEPWEEELSQYKERLEKLKNWEPGVSELVKKLPQIPLDYSPSPEGTVAIQLSLFVVSGCLTPTSQTIAAFSLLWSRGLLTMISLPVRLTFEIWGSAHYALQTIKDMKQTGNVEKALDRSRRLISGARSEVYLPWGDLTEEKSINVMEFIRSLQSIYSLAQRTYDFLCESCHPSFIMLTYWYLASPPIQNWTNEKFREHVHNMIESTLETMERSLSGISFDVKNTLELTIPYIQSDQAVKRGF